MSRGFSISLDTGAAVDGYASDPTGSACGTGPQPGAEALAKALAARFRGRAEIFACRPVHGGSRLSLHAEGRAVDWFPADVADAQRILDWLLAPDATGNEHALARRMGVQELIWNRRVWTARRQADGWRDHGGANPHTDHLHIGMSWAGARMQTSYWTAQGALALSGGEGRKASRDPADDPERRKELKQKQDELVRRRLWPTPKLIEDAARCKSLKDRKVAVIGGGFAGTTAAWYLTRFGVKVTLYEADDRLGGRVWTEEWPRGSKKKIDFGAELVGLNFPMWWLMKDLFGLKTVAFTSEEEYAKAGLKVQTRMGGVEVDRAKLLAKLESGALKKIGDDARDIDQFEPWVRKSPSSPDPKAFDAVTVAKKLDAYIGGATSLRPAPPERALLDFLLNNDNLAPAGNQSYLGLLALVSGGRLGSDMLGYWKYTETHRCVGGNQQLAERLGDAVTKKGSRVLAGRPVSAIELTDRGVDVTCLGKTESYDYVILTASPKVWHKIKLPFKLADYTMSHGAAVKFFGSFNKDFWTSAKPALAPSALWDELGSVWDSTDDPPAKKGTPPWVLCTYAGGTICLPKASDYVDRTDKRFPGYKKNLVKQEFVDWRVKPWVMTGYSVPAPNEVTTIAKRLVTKPYGDRIYFAGEQSHTPYFGYMEGALQSGARAARDIVDKECSVSTTVRRTTPTKQPVLT
jgi:monoamine oxidase